MPRVYERAPIAEAICEFRFPDEMEWDATIPGVLWEALRDRYPNRATACFVPSASLHVEADSVRHQVTVAHGLRFSSADGLAVVTILERTVSVHRLGPYPGWSVFQPEIAFVHGCIVDSLSPQPEEYARVTVRYLNRFDRAELGGESTRLEDYFEFYPHIGPRLPQDCRSFIAGVDLKCPGTDLRCRMMLTPSVAEETRAVSITLDIACHNEPEHVVALSSGIEFVEEAHVTAKRVFSGAITDKTDELLGGRDEE